MYQNENITLPQDKVDALHALAGEYGDSSTSALVSAAIDHYVALHTDWMAGIEKAVKEADAGNLLPVSETFHQIREMFWKSE